MDVAAWLPQVEQTLRDVIPDLAGLPLYIVPTSSAIGRNLIEDASSFGGMCYPTLDLLGEPMLRDEGRWQGRGPAFFLNDDSIREAFPDPRSFLQVATGISLHEACHWLCAEGPLTTISGRHDLPEIAQFFVDPDFFRESHRRRPGDEERPIERPPWHHHGTEFIRAAVHVGHRCELRRVWPSFHHFVFAGSSYGLSSPFTYRDTLTVEAESRRYEPIRDILKSPAPEAFLQLFANDTAG